MRTHARQTQTVRPVIQRVCIYHGVLVFGRGAMYIRMRYMRLCNVLLRRYALCERATIPCTRAAMRDSVERAKPSALSCARPPAVSF